MPRIDHRRTHFSPVREVCAFARPKSDKGRALHRVTVTVPVNERAKAFGVPSLRRTVENEVRKGTLMVVPQIIPHPDAAIVAALFLLKFAQKLR